MRVFLEHRQRTQRFFANPVKVFITANSAHRAATENFVVSPLLFVVRDDNDAKAFFLLLHQNARMQ
jgi:hypothetical protein